jgi:hypothetical protein
VVDELQRRATGARDSDSGTPGHDRFAPVHALVRDRVVSQPEHPAWAVLDRTRVERLLAAAPSALDTMSRYYVWRLAGVFLVADYASASIDPDRPGAPSHAAVGHH